MRAMMSRPVELKSKGEFLCLAGILEDASGPHARMAVAEARRILAETQACGCAGGWHWTPERGYWQCEGVAEPNILRIGEDPAAALADALAAFVGDAQ